MTRPMLETATAFFRLLEAVETDPAAYADILHPEVVQTEYPNALNPRGQESDRADMCRRMAQVPGLLARQRYELVRAHEAGDTLVTEVVWTGELAVDAGPLRKGQVMKAFICMAMDFRDGLIHRQRNYDCYEPLA